MKDFNIHTWQRRFLRENTEFTVNEDLQSDLLLANDGPLSTFGVLQRALDMAVTNRVSTDALANALYEVLKEMGAIKDIYIPSNEFR